MRPTSPDLPGPSRARGRRAAADASEQDAAPERLTLDVDWEQAGRWAGRLASPGPTGTRAELARTVEDLRDAAVRARPLAMRASRLAAAIDAAGTSDRTAEVLVVDRAGWARGAAQSFAALAAPVTGDRTGARTVPATAQTAGLLGLMAARVLGQFDPFAGSTPAGRLLLVAPNVLRTEQALSADPTDFRLWVCVHEQTHALQFAAAPWLADHLRGRVDALVGDLARTSAGQELVQAVSRGLRSLRAGDPDDAPLLEVMLEPEQRAIVQEVTAVMSVLEGHADVSMDAVGSRSIPTARRLRSRLEARRRSGSSVDRLLRRVIGLDAKLEQYRRGAVFVRAVRRSGGRDALDAVWSGPEALPTIRELADPAAWVRRVHG